MLISRVVAILILIPLLGGIFIKADAEATSTLNFGIAAPTSGRISYAGGAAPLIGTNIQVDNVTGLMTPINSGKIFTIAGGVLNFTTGNFIGSTESAWNFGGGVSSTITITGGIDLNNDNLFKDPGEIPIETVLLKGSFEIVTLKRVLLGNTQTFNIAGATFTDFKNKMLLDLFGMPKTFPSGDSLPYNGNLEISFLNLDFPPPDLPADPFTSILVGNGKILNTPVPEPGTFLLLSTGLAGIFFYACKKRKS